MKVLIKDLAYGRSGDKGDISNIGLIATNSENYKIIKKEVTPERVKEFFGNMVKGEVKVYPLDNLESLQIVMYEALGGGATKTLRVDQTGKSLCTAIMRMEVDV